MIVVIIFTSHTPAKLHILVRVEQLAASKACLHLSAHGKAWQKLAAVLFVWRKLAAILLCKADDLQSWLELSHAEHHEQGLANCQDSNMLVL